MYQTCRDSSYTKAPRSKCECVAKYSKSDYADVRSQNLYEVTTEDKLPSEPPPPAQISLTDCLACSGCVTSAEAVLVSLQSHSEVLNALDSSPSIDLYHQLTRHGTSGTSGAHKEEEKEEINKKGRIFVASVSPQVRASLAATYGTTDEETGWMIEQLLSGPAGIKNGGAQGSDFAWIVDTNAMREACLVMGAEELQESLAHPQDASEGQEGATSTKPKKPILTSACPGWICYAEKTHPHILPHLSRLKSPQALTGTLLKTVLSKTLDITPDRIWHLSIMPCFDKKLEASREELTDINWQSPLSGKITPPVRDVDCVITARELLMLAETRGISFPSLPRQPVNRQPYIRFPDKRLDCFLFTTRKSLPVAAEATSTASSRILRRLPLSHPPLPTRPPPRKHPGDHPWPQCRRNRLHDHPPRRQSPLPRRSILRLPQYPKSCPEAQTCKEK